MTQEKVCSGQCLFGKCPFGECVKYKTGEKKVGKANEKIAVLTGAKLDMPKTGANGYGLAVDIGTTTIAMLLYRLADGQPVGAAGALNDQVSFGLDVISRIKYCGDHEGGAALLHKTVIRQLNGMISQVRATAGIKANQIVKSVIAGNTTMMHLLAGLSPVSMGALPFEQVSYFNEVKRGGEIGLDLPNAEIYLPPCVSAFVGADITCDMLYAGFAESGKTCLLMDIGTNGEVALLHNGGILASSTAAGPAFEGAHISCGLAGVEGAIDRVSPINGKLKFTTIGGKVPRGLCGSGLLDAVAVFVKAGAIDKTGRIRTVENPYLKEIDGQPALVVTDDIFLTQKDVREIQNAKAAVAGGVLTLMHQAGIEEKDIETVYLAGGFGNYMDAGSAKAIGLVPRGVPVKTMGNAAAAGAAMLLFGEAACEEIEWIKKVSAHVELGGDPYFLERYVEQMGF